MNILIGIMYCIENEYDQCIASIQSQSYKSFKYFDIKGLSNKEAHSTLYKTFMESSEYYDLFIKVDADMVLCRPTFFQEVVEYFQEYPEVDDLEIKVSDFFTNRLIYGLHVYSNRVKWNDSSEEIFVDTTLDKSFNHQYDDGRLEPAALHCPDPSPFQCYHFGLHKAVKFLQYGKKDFNSSASLRHWNNIRGILENYATTRDLRLAIALTGATDAILKRFAAQNVDFTDTKALASFTRCNDTNFLRRASLILFLFRTIPRRLLRNAFLMLRRI